MLKFMCLYIQWAIAFIRTYLNGRRSRNDRTIERSVEIMVVHGSMGN